MASSAAVVNPMLRVTMWVFKLPSRMANLYPVMKALCLFVHASHLLHVFHRLDPSSEYYMILLE